MDIINIKSIYFIVLYLSSFLAFGQNSFILKNPNIRFNYNNSWKLTELKKDSQSFGKFTYSDLYGNVSQLIIGADRYPTNINSIWDLNIEKEKLSLAKTASIDSFVVMKRVINQNQVTILDFNAVYKQGLNEIHIKSRIYKYLLFYNNFKHVISFIFVSRDLNHLTDYNNIYDLMKDVVFNPTEIVNDKGIIHDNLNIPKLEGYLFYNESKYSELYTISEFSKSKSTVGDVELINLEFLVPKDELNTPAIHIYKLSSPFFQRITNKDFAAMKLFWKNTFEKTAKDNSIEVSILGKNIMKYNIVRSTIITDTANLLSIRLLLRDIGSDEHVVLIKNYIHYKENVFFIDLSKKFLEYKDFAVLDETSYNIIEKIFKYKY